MDALKNHIQKILGKFDEEPNDMLQFFNHLKVNKKKNLLTEGSICDSNYFVVKGCLRMFFINEKGVEQTIQFALENWWLSDYTSFSKQIPSDFYIQTVEAAELLAIDYKAQEEMLQRYSFMERYFRLIHQRAHAASQFRMKNMYERSREELYLDFSKRFPEFVQRIPQYLLASYLGFTPEYLSEIRKKKIS